MGQIPRSTERISSFIICPMLCYSNGTDNNNVRTIITCQNQPTEDLKIQENC